MNSQNVDSIQDTACPHISDLEVAENPPHTTFIDYIVSYTALRRLSVLLEELNNPIFANNERLRIRAQLHRVLFEIPTIMGSNSHKKSLLWSEPVLEIIKGLKYSQQGPEPVSQEELNTLKSHCDDVSWLPEELQGVPRLVKYEEQCQSTKEWVYEYRFTQ